MVGVTLAVLFLFPLAAAGLFGRCPAARTKCSLFLHWRAWVGRALGSRLCSSAACHRALWDAVSSSFQVDGGRQLASALPVACLTKILLKIQ